MFIRCIRPTEAVGNPTLVVFMTAQMMLLEHAVMSDGSWTMEVFIVR